MPNIIINDLLYCFVYLLKVLTQYSCFNSDIFLTFYCQKFGPAINNELFLNNILIHLTWMCFYFHGVLETCMLLDGYNLKENEKELGINMDVYIIVILEFLLQMFL